MKENVENGYAVRLPANNPAPLGRTWYVPQHCTSVLTKFRVVFDCSAICNGVLMNDRLLQGPDLTNNLVGSFYSFQTGTDCPGGDIKSMFLQVRVDEKDRDTFRFFWYPDHDLSQPPVHYVRCAPLHLVRRPRHQLQP